LVFDFDLQQPIFTNSLDRLHISETQPGVQGYTLRQASNVSLAHLISVMARYSLELATHGSRVGYYSATIAREIGLSSTEIDEIRNGGLLHDIGKIVIPWHVYSQPNELTDRDREQIEHHPADGERLSRSFSALSPLLPIIRHHHERFDGTGYPDKLAGNQIPLGAQIVAVADYYDALTSHRFFRTSVSARQAAVIMSHACDGHLNPELVEALLWGLEENAAETAKICFYPMKVDKEYSV
jgi:HD-GYP domain-containing protein (c-di-GMP phosphodiesterase class II)